MRDVTVGSLFSGAGLCDLGLEWAGMKHRFFCEVDPFCRSILRRHWPGIPIYEDVRELRGADLPPVDVLCGGFPCQDVSLAGKRKGIAKGTRSGLWHEYARLIEEIRPGYVIIENVPGLLAAGVEAVLQDLAAVGYDAEWEVLPAAAVGAPHRRERVFLVAYPNGHERDQSMGFYLRSPEVWEKATNLGAWLLGWEYGLTGRAARPSGRHMVDVSFAEWMMGVPQGWTAPQE